ncbi:hypothetical protein BJY04DRAFT_222529 [Aspergillus karnatakaensis]|uniref:DUF4267 domain-containing protein n=1 Tax=Aspergillus karnatakaensis TaxID=1810916 RepID=UPI003CCD2DE7
MAILSPLPAYLIGTLCLALGVNGLFRPEEEYPRFGLPLEPPAPASTGTTITSASPNASRRTRSSLTSTGNGTGTVSPLIYLKSIREITYGLALVALQYPGKNG